MTEGQLFLPGLKPKKGWYFHDVCCGSVEYLGNRSFVPTYDSRQQDNRMCGNQPPFMAMYFRLRTVLAEKGRDYIDDDSDRVYACGTDHLEVIMDKMKTQHYDIPSIPDVVVNAQGKILKEMHKSLARRAGEKITDRWFTGKNYSNGRDSLETLWAREKGAFF